MLQDDREADIVVRLRRAAVEDRLVKARWTLRGILVRALCIITKIESSYTEIWPGFKLYEVLVLSDEETCVACICIGGPASALAASR